MAAERTTPLARRQYEDLHPKDQQIKQTKKLCMEMNWQCGIQECLPEEIRPRVEAKKGAKVRVGDPPAAMEDWWNWSVELLKGLEELSAMTVGDLDYARELLLIEVQQRQSNPKSTQRKILEILLGDVQRVVDEQRKRTQAEFHASMMDTEEGAMDLSYGGANNGNYNNPMHGQITYLEDQAYNFDGDRTIRQPTVEDEYTHASPTMPVGDNRPFSSSVAGTTNTISSKTGDRLKIAELKARAARLRAEALRCDAEAIEWEVKAQELRDEMENHR